ncbi:MAG TPA: hypothetical protein VGX03_17145 [Candidatus Binatia bacterium]|jgi:hypothetical protein|nr:hypothetical protein [Candidatus Binatia bacterium]
MANSREDIEKLVREKFNKTLDDNLRVVADGIIQAQNIWKIEFTDYSIIFLMLPFLEDSSSLSLKPLDLTASLAVVFGTLYPILKDEKIVRVPHLLEATGCHIKPWC